MKALWVIVASTAAALPLGLAVHIDRFGRRERTVVPTAQAIVVLGARVLGNGDASPALEHRARRGAELFLKGRAPLLVFSGGSSGRLPSEARVASRLAIAQGVPESACVLEEGSHSTAENTELTAALLRARGVREVLLVTDGYHLLRATRMFETAGFTVHSVASQRPITSSERVIWTLREVAALARRPWLLL